MNFVMTFADLMSAIAILATLVVLALNVRDFWGTSTAEVFVYYGSASFLLGLISVFMHLSIGHLIPVAEPARTLGWHIMFYLSMSMFIAGTTALMRLNAPAGPARSFRGVIRAGLVPATAGAVAFIAAILLDGWSTQVFGGSVMDRIGVVHFIAFALCIGVVQAMRRLKSGLGSYLSSIAGPITQAVFIFGAVHLWELLSESWKVISLPDGWGDTLELVMVAIATGLIFVALLRTRRKHVTISL